MAWFLVVLAGIFEMAWSTAMKLSQGFTKPFWVGAMIVSLLASCGFLVVASKHLPLSLAYPVWTGIGAVGSIVVGTTCFHEQLSLGTWIFVVFLVIGIVGIQITSNH
ncbi:multidrug efflux SMR transporter [Lactobacillus sp. DCY120]|uniref:Multidrug efflux SMR transporter n=1 Tax=Bombilactobacillus apium TaxID=2675299 RepID=A0A850QW45_9LACO|nr:multidrug efflux SMR transporter [Bombilactobacillus apium]NVY96014.1 multidrug efflux SMR transporter [Bombilactobacillus apium]